MACISGLLAASSMTPAPGATCRSEGFTFAGYSAAQWRLSRHCTGSLRSAESRLRSVLLSGGWVLVVSGSLSPLARLVCLLELQQLLCCPFPHAYLSAVLCAYPQLVRADPLPPPQPNPTGGDYVGVRRVVRLEHGDQAKHQVDGPQQQQQQQQTVLPCKSSRRQ